MKEKQIAVVVPTIREKSIKRFLSEWKKEFSSYSYLTLFIIEDNPTKTFKLKTSVSLQHFCWDDIERDLGDAAWIIPHRSDCVRSYGYYKAYEAGADVVITLDDDCYPEKKEPYIIKQFIENLDRTVSTNWFNTINGRMSDRNGFYPRGFPYNGRDKEVVLCHGLWDHVPDFDGRTQLEYPEVRMKTVQAEATVVPRGILFPMCGMNLAVKREVIPVLYFLLMGTDKNGMRWGMDRFGDIWTGLFVKKIIDHLDKAVLSGEPVVHHDRASDPHKNMELEKAAIALNDELYEAARGMTLTKSTYQECYLEIAEQLPSSHEYFQTLAKAMKEWVSLFPQTKNVKQKDL